ncbi:MAG: flagellar export protein FliJ [Synergistaceae bacterium]|nr:flagellar export protein FliJ [Synergistaceae bacterium]
MLRFKKVLHVREVERDITQGELAVKMKEEEVILGRINEMEACRDDAMAEFCAERSRTVSPQQFWFERQNIEIMEKNLSSGRQELKNCQCEIEDKKNVLIQKHQNVQIMERYVGRLNESDHKKTIAAEQKNLDDITSMRFLWRAGGSVHL